MRKRLWGYSKADLLAKLHSANSAIGGHKKAAKDQRLLAEVWENNYNMEVEDKLKVCADRDKYKRELKVAADGYVRRGFRIKTLEKELKEKSAELTRCEAANRDMLQSVKDVANQRDAHEEAALGHEKEVKKLKAQVAALWLMVAAACVLSATLL